MRSKTLLRKAFAAALASVVLAGSAQAYGPLYIHDYETGTPYRWNVGQPVKVWTDGGNFASGTVYLWVRTPETCNPESGWKCGYSEELYVEFTNEQGVARVAEALESWSSVPTSSFQAEIAGSFSEIGIGGADGDITGAPEEFEIDDEGNSVHEVIGSQNNGGIHVLFDEDGSVMANILGAPYGVLGVATPEWADEETGEITEGWAIIGGAQTYYNDTDLKQMAGVITHELGHSFNLAHTQTNGHVIFFGWRAPVTTGPRECSAQWSESGDYRLPFPQGSNPTAADISVMYPYIDNNPDSRANPTGEYQATASTKEDLAAISSLYPAEGFSAETGTIRGSVTYAFSSEGVIGVNIVARNIDNPWEDAITAVTGDWNDGVVGAAQGEGEFTIEGLTPGARYAIHVENIVAGGFPTPRSTLPGPSEYYNGPNESDDAASDDACELTEITVGAGETLAGIDIQMNGMQKVPQLVILPAPNANNISESGKLMAGTIADFYGDALGWIRKANDKKKSTQTTRESYTILPMGALTMSDNGEVIGGRIIEGNAYLPARYTEASGIEPLPLPENNPCNQGGGFDEYYAHFAISPDGDTMGGFLWNCDDSPDYWDFRAAAATYSDDEGWKVLHDHTDNTSSRVNALADNGVAVGWVTSPYGFWEGRVWKDGEEINLKTAAPANIMDVGQATGVSSDGEWVIGINAFTETWETYSYRYNTELQVFEVLEFTKPCPWWDWFCFGSQPFDPYDIADDGTLVGAFGIAASSQATLVSDKLGGAIELAALLKGQGVINASDLATASLSGKISSNGKHIVGWTAIDGYFASFKLTLDQLWVCNGRKSQRVGYPDGVASALARGATLGMCEADLPLQYK